MKTKSSLIYIEVSKAWFPTVYDHFFENKGTSSYFLLQACIFLVQVFLSSSFLPSQNTLLVNGTVFTLNIGTSQHLTILVLKF